MPNKKPPANSFYGTLKSEADRLLKQNRKMKRGKSKKLNKHLTSIAVQRERAAP